MKYSHSLTVLAPSPSLNLEVLLTNCIGLQVRVSFFFRFFVYKTTLATASIYAVTIEVCADARGALHVI
jgi:hypothetical protein